MTTPNNKWEKEIKELFEIKNGYFPSGEATTKRFSVKEIQNIIKKVELQAIKGERKRIKNLLMNEEIDNPCFSVPKKIVDKILFKTT